jgi:hypothetical protein
MSQILDIQEKLQDTGAAIAQLEKAVALGPQSPSLIAMRKSLEKRLRNLEADFQIAASRAGIDVCSFTGFSQKAETA